MGKVDVQTSLHADGARRHRELNEKLTAAYRRGFHHGVNMALVLIARGATFAEIEAWANGPLCEWCDIRDRVPTCEVKRAA
jgi:hypothetical protein